MLIHIHRALNQIDLVILEESFHEVHVDEGCNGNPINRFSSQDPQQKLSTTHKHLPFAAHPLRQPVCLYIFVTLFSRNA
jgi:hypothetical protein